MTRIAYHKELKELEKKFLNMGEMVIKAVNASVEALSNNDIKAAKSIILNDYCINKERFDIEEECLLVIATQQPVARDLRSLAALLSVITDLERIADHAEGIAKICVMNNMQPIVKPLIYLPKMQEKAVNMLQECLIAFVEKDVDAAKRICDKDDEVDELYDQIYKESIMLMIDNSKIIEGATFLIWVAHNLERIADRATNIAERVVFMVNGKMEELNVSNY